MTSTHATRPRRSAGKRLLFAGVALALLWLAIEVVAFGAYWLMRGEAFSYAAMRDAQREAAREEADEDVETTFESKIGVALHPYLGFVFDPAVALGALGINEHGFLSEDGPIVQREPNTVIVAVFGGSVAEMFYTSGRAELERRLREHPALAEKRFRFLSFALGGYKQPQQLLALTYVLGLGGEVDVAICLDGFNDIALPVSDNLPAGVHPVFPRGWSVLAQARMGSEERRALGDVQAIRGVRRRLARAVAGTPLGWSVLANVAWDVADRRLERAEMVRQTELQTMREGPRPFHVTGPRDGVDTEDEARAAAAGAWRDGAIQMDRLCRANGARFFHFLQPNQYLAGSKPFGAAERAVAYDPDSRFRVPIERGYPVLRAAGEEVRAAGVDYHDLTQVFAAHEEPLYIDTCCHLNPRGNEILARVMADVIKASYDGEAVATTGLVELVARPAAHVLTEPLVTRQVAIDGVFDDGSTRDVTFARVAFRTSDASVATVSEYGVVQAIRPGRATITAEKGGLAVEVPVEVAFPPVAPFGRGVPGFEGPRLRASIDDRGRVAFELDRIEPGVPAVLLLALRPEPFHFCDARLLVPFAASTHLPLPVDGERGAFAFDPPPSARGATTYWQAVARDSRAACEWWASNGIALTLPE